MTSEQLSPQQERKKTPMALPLASVQLYSLAKEFSADPDGSLEKLAGLGLQNVEAFDFVRRPDEVRAALDAAGLASPTGHAPLLSDELWTPDGSIPTPAPEVVFEAAAKIGIDHGHRPVRRGGPVADARRRHRHR